MTTLNVLLAGNGRMALAMEKLLKEEQIWLDRFRPDLAPAGALLNKTAVAIHLGSGRELPALVDLCERADGMPIIQGSSQVNTGVYAGRKVTIINVPNFALPMIRFMRAFPEFARKIAESMTLNVVESHQECKKDASATAERLLRDMHIPDTGITAVRKPALQMAMGVSEEHLEAHAHHHFIFTGDDVTIRISTEINGREAYVKGALALAKALVHLPRPMKFGIYGIEDLPDLVV